MNKINVMRVNPRRVDGEFLKVFKTDGRQIAFKTGGTEVPTTSFHGSKGAATGF